MATKKKPKPVEKVHSGQIFTALREKYGRSAVVIAEVPNATGHRNNPRRLDAVAVGCWPSRGLYFHGIEIKVSRGDLARELKTPEKAEAIAAYCDAFYLACPKGMVKPEEILLLPEQWGLYEYSKGKVRVAKQPTGAATRELDRDWVAALVRAVVEQHDSETVLAKREAAGTSAGWAAAKAHYEESNEKLYQEAQDARRKLGEYEHMLRGWRYGGKVTPAHLRRLMQCIDSLQGNMGALNSLKVSGGKVVAELETIANLVNGIFPDIHEPAEAGNG